MAIVTVACDKCFYYFQFLLYMLIAFLFVFKSVFVLLTLSIALYVYYQVSFGFFCFFSFQEMMRFLLQRHRLISFLLYTIGKKRKHFVPPQRVSWILSQCLRGHQPINTRKISKQPQLGYSFKPDAATPSTSIQETFFSFLNEQEHLACVAYTRTPNFIGIHMILDMRTFKRTLIFSLRFFKVFKIFVDRIILYYLKTYCYIIGL